MSDFLSSSEPKLWMITGEVVPSSVEGEKSGGSYKGGQLGDSQPVEDKKNNDKVAMPIAKLQQNLHQFLQVVGDLFSQAEQEAQKSSVQENQNDKPEIELDQIEFSVAVNGEGEVGFWGLAQGKVGGTTEIKLTFKRKEG